MSKVSLIVLDRLHTLFLIVDTNICTIDTMTYIDLWRLNGDIAGLAVAIRTDCG